MKSTSIFTLFALLAFISFSFTGAEKPVAVNVDTAASVIKWKGYKVTGQHNGSLRLKSGSLEYKNNQLAGGNFVIDMASITVEDLQGQGKEKLEGHLKSDDFFGVSKFPTAKFVITSVISRGKPGEYKVAGDLTIKESTKPIKFNVVETTEGGKRVAKADITLDRSEYNVRFGSGSFFENLGDKTIYDEFDLQIELVSNLQ